MNELLLPVLEKTYELLEDPNRWTTGVAARNHSGEAVASSDSRATCWCLSGAFVRSAGRLRCDPDQQYRLSYLAYDFTARFLNGMGVVAYNDTHTHAEVLSLLQTAINAAREEQSRTPA